MVSRGDASSQKKEKRHEKYREECSYEWKHKKKDKEKEALPISEDTAFVITGENIRPKPNPSGLVKDKKNYKKSSKETEVLQPTRMPNTKSSIRRISKEVVNEKGPVKIENDEQTRISIIVDAIKNTAERDSAKTKVVVENQEEDAVKNK
ncbi:hypothetical protein Tco_0739670 [Tanacetum coccineum]